MSSSNVPPRCDTRLWLLTIALCVIIGCGKEAQPTSSVSGETTAAEERHPSKATSESITQESGGDTVGSEDQEVGTASGDLVDEEADVAGSQAESSIAADQDATVGEVKEDDASSDDASRTIATIEDDDASEVKTSAEDQFLNPAYTLWVPTSVGPLLVGADIDVSGDPLVDVFDRRLGSIRREVSDADDATIDWDDLIEHVSENPEQFGRSVMNLGSQSKQLRKRYDRNGNGQVEDDELKRFVFRDANFSTEFRAFGTDAFRWTNRTGSALFAAMDRNGDRKLDGLEVEQADQSLLRMIDLNGDECISLEEAGLTAGDDENPWMMRRSDRHGNVAMDLSGYISWNNLAFALEGFLGAAPLLATNSPVDQVDRDSDGRLSVDEAREILKQRPALRCSLRFDTSNGRSAVEVSVVDADYARATVAPVSPAMVAVEDANLIVLVTLQDDPVPQNRIPREAFDLIDANDDGAIDQKELPEEARGQIDFDALDADENGRLTFDEINAAIDEPRSVWLSQVRCRCAEYPDAVFIWLDQNRDQFLSTRELRAAPARLASIAEEDSGIRPQNIPDAILIQFTRGEPNQDESRYRLSRIVQQQDVSIPHWAAAMDANRDGEISTTEFIGPIESFREFDSNGDAFLDQAEIEKAK